MKAPHNTFSTTSKTRSISSFLFAICITTNLVGCLQDFNNLLPETSDTGFVDTESVKTEDITEDTEDTDDVKTEDVSEDPNPTCGTTTCTGDDYCFEGKCYTPPVLALGSEHSCAMLNNTVKCWGSNKLGQLGSDYSKDVETRAQPQEVEFTATPLAIYAGAVQSCALTQSNMASDAKTVYCWGDHSAIDRQAETPFDVVPVKIDGSSITQVIEELAMTTFHSCVRFRSNSLMAVRCWGNNFYGQLGADTNNKPSRTLVIPELDRSSTKISVGDTFSCSLNNDSSVSCWGNNQHGQLGRASVTTTQIKPGLVEDLTGVTSIATGREHACAILTDKTVKCWGQNLSGALGTGKKDNAFKPTTQSPPLEAVKQLALGNGFTCALLESGELYCAGTNSAAQLGVSISPVNESTIFIKNKHLKDVHQITAGSLHLCAVHGANKVSCWGLNSFNQTGNDTSDSHPEPHEINLGD